MIEKVLNETSVTPKITLTQTEYNRLVELAQANAKQIDERAVEYYKKNGVCGIHIDAYVREQNGAHDEIADTFRFDCQPRYGYVRPSDEYRPNPLCHRQRDTAAHHEVCRRLCHVGLLPQVRQAAHAHQQCPAVRATCLPRMGDDPHTDADRLAAGCADTDICNTEIMED